MKFFDMLPGQRLILIKTSRSTMPPCPVLATQAQRITPAYQALIIWLLRQTVNAISCIGDHWPPPIWTENRPKLTVLMFLAGLVVTEILMSLANSYVQKMVGV